LNLLLLLSVLLWVPETLPVQLSTELRARSRHEWEKWKHEKEMESALERIEREKQREREEFEQMKTLRNEAVHKANPVRIYKPVVIMPSTQPLTLPESPRFSDRLRAKMLRH
jgi:targeting protein for Xklp2